MSVVLPLCWSLLFVIPYQRREPASESVPAKALLSEAMNALDAAQRFALGKKCKRLIDMGRLLWLREKGMQAKLVEYIADTVSPENKVLLAKRV
jgi:tRNA:m4X modification enzyme